MYKKILVPLDGSKRAEVILPHVVSLSQKFGSTVILFQVLEPEFVLDGPEVQHASDYAASFAHKRDQTEAYLGKHQQTLIEQGIETVTRLGQGPVVEGIINEAIDEDVDLVALVSHGRTGLGQVFYGSIAAGILHRVDRPLLLIRSLDQK